MPPYRLCRETGKAEHARRLLGPVRVADSGAGPVIQYGRGIGERAVNEGQGVVLVFQDTVMGIVGAVLEDVKRASGGIQLERIGGGVVRNLSEVPYGAFAGRLWRNERDLTVIN